MLDAEQHTDAAAIPLRLGVVARLHRDGPSRRAALDGTTRIDAPCAGRRAERCSGLPGSVMAAFRAEAGPVP